MTKKSRFASWDESENVKITTPVQCPACVHWRGDATCEAFPEGVPIKILSDKFDHRFPFPGDHGIMFEPVDEDDDDEE